jgi:hypothetical protein
MNQFALQPKTIKAKVTRIENLLQNADLNDEIFEPIIKDYIYIESRRIIA